MGDGQRWKQCTNCFDARAAIHDASPAVPPSTPFIPARARFIAQKAAIAPRQQFLHRRSANISAAPA